ncbi:histone-lysine N-methyltransferase SETMAR [Trichonephila clavipes]|nr:histone-lysine N-methyltransferase SETMAR [Trichonephila clavipes]
MGAYETPPVVEMEAKICKNHHRRPLLHAAEPGTTVNGSYYANVPRAMIQHVKRKRPLLRNGFLLHYDNARPHIARCVLDVSQKNTT